MKHLFKIGLASLILLVAAVGCAQYDTSGRLASRVWVSPGPSPTYEQPNYTLIPPDVR